MFGVLGTIARLLLWVALAVVVVLAVAAIVYLAVSGFYAVLAFHWPTPPIATPAPVAPPAPAPPVAPPVVPTPSSPQRMETGQNRSLHFDAGSTVFGWKIVLDSGQMCDGGNCLIHNTPVGGNVTSGVINPWPQEIAGLSDSNFGNQPAPSPITTNVAPYNLPPQPEIGHPSVYLETGVPCKNVPQGTVCADLNDHTKHWVIPLLTGTTAIVGGFNVDGTSNGVYKAVAGPGTLDTTVTDGFVAITKNEWANTEFCFRIAQAVQFGWAHATETPLSGWSACQ